MHKNYKQDEFVMQCIIKEYISPVDPTKHIKLIIYEREKLKPSILIVTNNTMLTRTNLIYKFTHPLQD